MSSETMTYSIDRKAFKAVVDLVKKASDKRVTYPILGNIELRADGHDCSPSAPMAQIQG